jgi:hypothetical protein
MGSKTADFYFCCKDGQTVGTTRLVLALKSLYFRKFLDTFTGEHLDRIDASTSYFEVRYDSDVVQLAVEQMTKGRVAVPAALASKFESICRDYKLAFDPNLGSPNGGTSSGRPVIVVKRPQPTDNVCTEGKLNIASSSHNQCHVTQI